MKAVLLVEDNDDDIFMMQRSWQKTGIPNPLLVVRDGQEAVNYFSGKDQFADRRRFPIPCLILLDLKLPYLSGLEVLQWLRAHEASGSLPVVFLTSSNKDSDVQTAYRKGANGYLVKPATPQKLGELLQDIQNFWLKQNRFPLECLGDGD